MVLSVNLVLNAIDQFSAEFRKMSGGLKSITRFAKIATVAIVGIGALGALRTASEAAATFELSMARVQAVTTGADERFDELRETALQLGKDTFFTANQISQAMFELGQAGLSASDVLAALEPVLDLAQIGFIETGRAGEIATDIMAGLGLGSEDLIRVVDVLTETFTSANTTIDALGTAFAKVGPLAATLDIELEELAAAMGVLANRGIKGEEAGTALRNIFLRLLNPSREASKVLDQIGLSTEAVASGELELVDILGLLKLALDDGTIGVEDIAKVFQARATPAVLALIGSLEDGEQGLAAFTTALENSEGAAEKITDTLEATTAFTFAEFKATLEGLAIELGEKLNPLLIDLIGIFQENEGAISDVIAFFGVLIKVFIELIPPLIETIDVMKEFFEVLDTASGGSLPEFATALLIIAGPLVQLIQLVGAFADELRVAIDFLDKIAESPFGKLLFGPIGLIGIGADIGGAVTGEAAEVEEFSHGGLFRVTRGGQIGVDEREIVAIANPARGQTLATITGGAAGVSGPVIGSVTNIFQTSNPDPVLMERATRSYLRRMELKR